MAQAWRSMDRHHRRRWMLFNKLPQDNLGTGRRSVLHLCGCSSVGRARPRHGRGHEFETRHPLHFGCVHALRGHATWCWWSGMCAALGQAPCSETPHPTGCSRLGTAEVDLQFRRVRLDGRGHRAFNPGTRVRIPHATPEQRSPRRAHASRVEIGRNDWAAPEPVTGWIQWGCSSTPGRAAALQAAGCRFEPCHLHQCNNASLTQRPECRPV